MPLSNSQYDKFIREYDEKQLKRTQLQHDRLSLIRKKIPQYGEIENSISSICVAKAMHLVNSDDATDLSDIKKELELLKKKKTDLLSENGYPSDYLEPPFDCPDCKDTGFIDNQKCHCFKQKIVSLLYGQSNLGPTLSKENFSTLSYKYYKDTDLDSFKKAVKTSKKFVDNFPSGGNILLFGNVGSGKTFLSKCITKELIDKGYPVIYFSAGALTDVLIGKSGSDEDFNVREEILCCDLLIIDDLGTEYPKDFTISKLFECLDKRLEDKKSTIISTNLSLKDLRDIYTERIFSRIASSYEMLRITCPDIRIQKASL